jgi:AcrR family transcriptional regulator
MASRSIRVKYGAVEPEDTRKKLLDAAAEVFAEIGYHRATVRDICARAGVNGALVNYHFGDKLELYTQVLQGLFSAARIEDVRAALNQKAPPETILRDVIRARLRGVAASDQKGWIFRILTHEVAQPTPAMTRIINTVSRPLYNQMCEIIGMLICLPAGDEKTRLCAHSIMGQIMFYVLARPLLNRIWPDLKMTPEQMERIANHVADFSLAYLRQVRDGQRQAVKAANGRKRK